jgi:hypothetical protein
MEEQNYCRLGERGEIKEDSGRDHLVVAKGTNY